MTWKPNRGQVTRIHIMKWFCFETNSKSIIPSQRKHCKRRPLLDIFCEHYQDIEHQRILWLLQHSVPLVPGNYKPQDKKIRVEYKKIKQDHKFSLQQHSFQLSWHLQYHQELHDAFQSRLSDVLGPNLPVIM